MGDLQTTYYLVFPLFCRRKLFTIEVTTPPTTVRLLPRYLTSIYVVLQKHHYNLHKLDRYIQFILKFPVHRLVFSPDYTCYKGFVVHSTHFPPLTYTGPVLFPYLRLYS